MPEFRASSEVIHRTDASVTALPWAEVRDRLASESYYKVEFKQPGTHNLVDLMIFAVKGPPELNRPVYKIVTTFEHYDITYRDSREVRKPQRSSMKEDLTIFDSVPEVLMAAKVEAILYHAHVRGFKYEAS